jgi:hypothetical protein
MARRKDKPAGTSKKPLLPAATAVAPRRAVDRTRGRVGVGVGVALLIGGIALAMTGDGQDLALWRFFVVQLLGIVGALAIAAGGYYLDPRPDHPASVDTRRWIYGVLAALFAVVYGLLMWKVIPNRLPSAMLHLATVPVFTLVMATGTLLGGRAGWWIGVVGGSLVLLSTIVLIARILASAAFLAGVYGAFGKAASTFALVSVALIIELVGILPICQVKFLMSRTGRRTYGL